MKKKFNTTFNTNGWAGIYIAGILFSLVISIISRLLSFFLVNSSLAFVLGTIFFPILRILILALFITMAYTKAIILFINTLSLGNKKFSLNLEYSSFFLFVLSNMIISIFTLGIYIPWAYEKIMNKLAKAIKCDDESKRTFRSKASQLFVVLFVSIILILVACSIFVATIMIVGKNTSLLLIFVPVGIVIFFGLLAIIAFLQIYTINWFCNLGVSSDEKDVVYSLNINIANAIMFYFAQSVLLIITLGLYAGAFLLNVYEYFAIRIEEKTNGEQTGRILFEKPIDKGAGFLLIQIILCFITAGIYTPFAYVEYAKFFINNTYLETKEDEKLAL